MFLLKSQIYCDIVNNDDYHIKKAFVVSNERSVIQKGKITYIPIYYIMFFNTNQRTKKSETKIKFIHLISNVFCDKMKS